MSMLIAEPRADKNGKIVVRHVKGEFSPQNNLRAVPAPNISLVQERSDIVEVDDLNLMASLRIFDTNSSACENVETYLEDEYGATFEYDLEEGTETVIFESAKGYDRFSADFYSGELREELKEIARNS
jgi:hypothetical protein